MIDIIKFNNDLVESKRNINIIDYVKEINRLSYNIDIEFIDEFIQLVDKDECCIHHNLLQKYGIISLNKGSTDIKRILEQNNFIENEDFNLRNVAEVRKNRGNVIKNEYYLHPNAFKICLIRSLKTRKYVKYYLLLEKCIKYFNDYQLQLNKKYTIKLETKVKEQKETISNLENKLDEVLSELKKSNEKLDISTEELKQANSKLDNMNENLEDVKYDLEEVKDELKDTNIKLDISLEDRAPKTKSISTRELFILLKTENKNSKYKYYVIRGQKRYITKKLEQMLEEEYIEVKRYLCIPKAINLLLRIKEKLKSKIICVGNKFNTNDITEDELLLKIDNIYNEKNIIIN